MKPRWWKHPEMIWLYGLFGGVVGVVVGIILCSLVQGWALTNPDAADGYGIVYSGVSGIFLLGQQMALDAFLGGVSGCLFTHVFGKYCFFAAPALAFCGFMSALLVASLAFPFASDFGRETALAVYGVYFFWSLLMTISGTYFTRKISQ